MAQKIISGITANYTDRNSGVNLPSAWLQIRQINYVAEYSCHIVVDVYMDQVSYDGGKEAVFTNIISPLFSVDADFDTFFTVGIMRFADHDIATQAMAYLNSIFN